MYQVLIADDEDIIRRGLASFVRKDSAFQVVAMAEDGEMALELAQQQKIDLAFVDINMPFMNGLEFVEKLITFQPNVLVVIITGYDDFQFVQQALRLGAVDYLLKPVMEQPFFELLNRLKQRLDRRVEREKYMAWAEEQVERNRSALIDNVFARWLDKRLGEEEFRSYSEYLGIQVPQHYTLTLILLHEQSGLHSEQGIWEEDLLYYACQNIAQEIFDFHSKNFCFHYDGTLVLISETMEKETWETLMQKVRIPMQEYFPVLVNASFSVGMGLSSIPDAFERAESAVRTREQYSDNVRRAISYAEQHFSDSSLGVQTIAEALHISQQYLSRTFRQETGDTFGAYLSQLRIRKAVELLHDPGMKMYEVAVRAGYTSQHYFSSAFKKILGVSPVEYQKSIKDGK